MIARRETVVIFGAGGLARELLVQIESSEFFREKYVVIGLIVDDEKLLGTKVNGYEIIGDTKFLLEYESRLNVIVALGDVYARNKVVTKLKENSLISFPNFISEDARVSKFVKLGEGCIICDFAVATVNIEIGDFVLLGINTVIGHDSKIGDYVSVYPGSTLSGNVEIGSFTELGTGTNVVPKIKVGNHCKVGAGAAVTKNIPNFVLAAGVPAIIKKDYKKEILND